MRVALAIALLAVSPGAQALEVARDASGGVLELSGFYKNFLTGLVLQPGTVMGSRALGIALPEFGALDGNLLRLTAKFRFTDKFEFEVADQLSFLVASDPALTGGASLTTTIGGTGAGPQRRLVPLGGTLYQSSNTRLDHELDRLALKLPLPFGDLTVGRQVLSWGTGRFFNPTDVLSPFAPTAIDREVRRGFDAVRLAIAVGDVTQLDLLYLPQQKAEENGGVARFQTNVRGWDGSISLGKYVRDFVAGADLVGDLGPVAVHAEAAYTVEWLESGVGDHFLRAVVGADLKPLESLVLTAEYSFNGFGSTDASKYAAILSSPRAPRGEVFGAGMHTAAIAASWRANDLLSTQLSVLCNVTDPSALVLASLEYSLIQSVLIRAGGYVPIGRGPDPSVFTRLSPADVQTQSPAYRAALATRGLRSEYGSGAYGAFVQVGLYVP